MTASIATNDVQGLEYVVLGIATCFQRNDEGRLQEVAIAEPVPAAELDCLYNAARPSSYTKLYATTFAEIVREDAPQLPTDVVPTGVFPGQDFVERARAATRSYRAKPNFKHIPLGNTITTSSEPFALNYSPEPKRILNVSYEPSEADNVKQHTHTHTKLWPTLWLGKQWRHYKP